VTVPEQFIRPRGLDAPALRLIVFHHAGGSGAVYFPLTNGLPADWDLLLVDLPGRGRRHRTPPIEDMDSLITVATADILPWADAPLALFGHSMGAVVAVEVARSLQVRGRSAAWLGVSGQPAPAYLGRDGLPSADSSDEQLLAALGEMGGIPDRIDDVPTFRDRFVRLVRSDLRAVESYRPAPARPRLTAPITVFGAIDDPLAPPAALAAWTAESAGRLRRRSFAGGHFYFLGAAFADFTSQLVEEVRAAISTDTAGVNVLTLGGSVE
jgi:surfactin synthase thioesterase subunit